MTCRESPASKAMPSAEKRGLECRHCGCKHLRVVYTRPAMWRPDNAPARVPLLRQEADDFRAPVELVCQRRHWLEESSPVDILLRLGRKMDSLTTSVQGH